MVEYENGDPDRPIIVGSVYNGNNTVPMNLPGKKNNSGILTKSTPNSQGYNFLLFNDTAGSEVVKLRCQRDLMFKALRNEQRDIGADQTENVGGNETINVGPVDPAAAGGSAGGGNFTLNAFQSITLNVGPADMPLTQIKMDQDEHHPERWPRRPSLPNQDGRQRRNDQRHSRLTTYGATLTASRQ